MHLNQKDGMNLEYIRRKGTKNDRLRIPVVREKGWREKRNLPFFLEKTWLKLLFYFILFSSSNFLGFWTFFFSFFPTACLFPFLSFFTIPCFTLTFHNTNCRRFRERKQKSRTRKSVLANICLSLYFSLVNDTPMSETWVGERRERWSCSIQ